MFLLSRRQAHAALAGAAAACAWLAAAEVSSKKPVKVSGLFLLSSAALAGIVAQAGSRRASDKAHSVEQRLNGFFANGGQVGGDLVIHGNHTINGTHTINGETYHGGNRIHGVDHVYSNGGGIGFYDQCYMNGHDFWMQGGTLHANDGNH